MDKDAIQAALTRVMHPSAGTNIVEAGAIKKIAACDGYVSVTVMGGGTHSDQRASLKQQIGAAVRLWGQQAKVDVQDVHVEITEDQPANVKGSSDEQAGKAPAREGVLGGGQGGVRHVIAVGAGKGGVGKSTVAVNLAVGLARKGHAVGLMDGDIYGPSVPTLMGLDALDVSVVGDRMTPIMAHGVKSMTLGKLVDADKPLIWRGPMAHGAFKQLVEKTDWGELDYLIVDLPPGTGDVPLTLAQTLRLTGAVIVCTPQKVAQDDAVRAAKMFSQLGIEVLGVVENMSYFIGDDGKEYDLFGRGGAERMAQRLGLPFLGAVPINMDLRINSDAGEPSKNYYDGGQLAGSLEALIKTFEGQVTVASLKTGAARPTLKIN